MDTEQTQCKLTVCISYSCLLITRLPDTPSETPPMYNQSADDKTMRYRYTCQESRVYLFILWPDLSVGIWCSLQPLWDTFRKPQHTTPQCPLMEVTYGRWSLTAGHQVHDGEYPHQETKEARVMWSGKLFLVVRMTSADV